MEREKEMNNLPDMKLARLIRRDKTTKELVYRVMDLLGEIDNAIQKWRDNKKIVPGQLVKYRGDIHTAIKVFPWPNKIGFPMAKITRVKELIPASNLMPKTDKPI